MARMSLSTSDRQASVLVTRQSETYGSIYEGQITTRLNQHVINMAVEKARQLWPELPVVVLQPNFSRTPKLLPGVQCLSLLHSDQPSVRRGNSISRLVLIHFEDDMHPYFSEMTQRQISNLRWTELAKDATL